MSHDLQLYTVTVRDLGTYTLTIAAQSETEAESIAKDVMHEDVDVTRHGIHVLARDLEVEAVLDPDATANSRDFVVEGRWEVDFEISVPALNMADAKRHAQRLYRESGPFDFSCEQRTYGWQTREVQS